MLVEPNEPEPVSLPVCRFPNRIVVVQGGRERGEEVLHRILRKAKNLRVSGGSLDEVVMVCISTEADRFLQRASLGTALLDLLADREGLLRIVAGTSDQHLYHQLFSLAGYWTEGTVSRSRLRLEFPSRLPLTAGGAFPHDGLALWREGARLNTDRA